MMIWSHIEQVISDRTASLFQIKQRQSLSGGDTNIAYKVSDGVRHYFVKMNRKSQAFMFLAEGVALNMLQKSNTIIVPEVIAQGVYGSDSYLVLGFIDMQGQPDSRLFGEKLAQLHSCYEQQFGFDVDNIIGATAQVNAWTDNWVEFWQKHRLGRQLELARQNGLDHKLYDLGLQLIDKTPYFFQSYQPKASLLHGDLWRGNWSANAHGEPILFDPASYFGDHEADLAMTELFGHPGVHFYESYQQYFVIDDGYAVRKLFYNVYHIINHANLFGGEYVNQAINSIEQLLAE